MVVENKASKSVRTFISWNNGSRLEPTSTLVLSSPEHRFVDVRILLPLSGHAVGRDEETQVDWAFAGTSEHDSTSDPPHTVFQHWVDSRYSDANTVRDEGDMVVGGADEEGVTLERGTMVNPETGQAEGYEEGWRDIEVERDVAGGWVLRYENLGGKGNGRGLMVKVGRDAQGVLRDGTEVAVARWRVEDGDGRRSVVGIGGIEGFYTGKWNKMRTGDEVAAEDGRRWVCIEDW